MSFDPLHSQTQGLAVTPDNHLPQLTGLPSSPPPMTIPTLSHSVPNHLSMTTQTFSPLADPIIMPPPASVCGCGFCRLPEVPQRPYQSTQISVESGSKIGEIVTFSKGGCGILLRDAIENRLSGLVGGDDIMFDGFNVSAFSLRIEVRPAFQSSLRACANRPLVVAGLPTLDWEGKGPQCTPPLTKHSVDTQFRARNWGGNQGQISRARLATQIAKRIAESITVRFPFL